jgi:hypothetical protein
MIRDMQTDSAVLEDCMVLDYTSTNHNAMEDVSADIKAHDHGNVGEYERNAQQGQHEDEQDDDDDQNDETTNEGNS